MVFDKVFNDHYNELILGYFCNLLNNFFKWVLLRGLYMSFSSLKYLIVHCFLFINI